MKNSRSKVLLQDTKVQSLVINGLCTVEDIENASKLAYRLASGENAWRIKSMERIFKALSDCNRIRILLLLAEKEMCVCELMAALKMSEPTASRNLNILEQVGLARKRRVGRWTFYGLTDTTMTEAIRKILAGAVEI
ncbi:MAG: metalloregulator ArsR/SmtB family transcription factor [Methanomassiliicoccales archaeon]